MTQYQSIYRKWRPQTFEDIIGQNHITQTLRNAIRLNRTAHAYLFSGPRGVGKTTTARIFAMALNCQHGPTETPCGECTTCIRISQGQSMDVLEIDGASNRGIDEIRELRSKIGFAPVEGKYKIYIIDEVHMLTNEAFNALLKTLEEPPAQVIFIFATTAPHKVPNTILSRCQSFYFHRISVEEMVEKLKKIVSEDKLNIDVPSLRIIAQNATGSLRDAESILDQVITYSENEVTPEQVGEILGIMPHEVFYQLLETIIDKDTEAGLKIINKLIKDGIELNQFVQDLIIYSHNLSLIKILGKENAYSSIFTEQSDLEKAWKLAAKTDIKNLLDIMEEFKKVEEKIKFHHFPWILLELMIVKLSFSEKKPARENSQAKDTSKGMDIPAKREEKSEQKKVVIPEEKQKASAPEVGKKTLPESDKKYNLETIWPKVLSRIKEEKISLYFCLVFGSNICIENEQLMISFSPEHSFHKENLEKKENKKKIEEILREEIGSNIRLNCISHENNSEKNEVLDFGENRTIIGEKLSFTKKTVDVEENTSEGNNKESSSENSEDILKEALNLFGGELSEE